MDALSRVSLRPLAAVALLILQVGCGTITLAPDPDGAVPEVGDAASTSAPPPGPPPREGGPAGPAACVTDDDCHKGKTNRCDTATGACVACLTDGDCDGDRTCSTGKCAGADGKG